MTKYSNINDKLKSVEKLWLVRLFNFSKQEFNSIYLPSHNHFHHLRVWNYTKGLLYQLECSGYEFNINTIELLILASFFHDIGLTKTLDSLHGKISRSICENYLKDNNLIVKRQHLILFDAIEHHDDKDYQKSLSNKNNNQIYKILTICDDLDAFGHIGIYRYFEIYYLRNIEFVDLIPLVIDNLDSRFVFLNKQFGFLKHFIQKHEKRYLITKKFYSELKDKKSEKGEIISSFIELMKQHLNIFKAEDHKNIQNTMDKSGVLFYNKLFYEIKSITQDTSQW